MGKNGCAHTRTTNKREGNDMVSRCDACGAETARTTDAYDD